MRKFGLANVIQPFAAEWNLWASRGCMVARRECDLTPAAVR